VLATAGGLVFAGDDDGRLYAFAAGTGRIVWRFDSRLRFGSAPIAYEIRGREFIAVAAGGSLLSGDGARGGGELFVFALPS
jgi:outer membrane protein assembly factor BamB